MLSPCIIINLQYKHSWSAIWRNTNHSLGDCQSAIGSILQYPWNNRHHLCSRLPLFQLYLPKKSVSKSSILTNDYYSYYVNIIMHHCFRLIRITSPNLNYLIGIGAIILYIDIGLFVAPSTNHKVVTVLCNVSSFSVEVNNLSEKFHHSYSFHHGSMPLATLSALAP